MATTFTTLIGIVRLHLNENTASATSYWTDNELAALIALGAKDLWRAINDNFQHYFLTIDATNVSLAAGASTLTGVPSDVSIVRGLECRSLSDRPGVVFEYRDYNHVDFQRARAIGTQDTAYGGKIFYCVTGAGGPVAAPTIQVAPAVNATLTLRLSYVPTLAAMTTASSNPIPGESDNALVAWAVAYAMAKQSEDQQPDAGWLNIYATEKANILTSLAPRQTEDEETAEAMFEDEWS